MRSIYWLNKIAAIGFILSCLGSIYCEIIIRRNKKVFFKDLDQYVNQNPDAAVSKEEAAELQEKFNQMFTKPLKVKVVLTILYLIFGVVGIVFR